MSAVTWVIVKDPVGQRDLFDEMRSVAKNRNTPVLNTGKHCDSVHMYMAPGDGALARVSVQFRPDGSQMPPEGISGAGDPDGYAHGLFGTGWLSTDDATWKSHAELVRALSQWLGARRLDWCWSFHDDPWIHGSVPAKRGGR